MHLEFHDTNGESGIVWEDYSVEYEGEKREEVADIVATVLETRFDSTDPPRKAVFEELMIDLYDVPSIVFVAKMDGASGTAFEGTRRVRQSVLDSCTHRTEKR